MNLKLVITIKVLMLQLNVIIVMVVLKMGLKDILESVGDEMGNSLQY